MKYLRQQIAAAVSLLLIAAFILLPLPSASAQDKPPAEKKKTVLQVGYGQLVIKKTEASAFSFKLTDPNTGEALLAKGTFEVTEKSLQFRMTEPGGRATGVNATRTDGNHVIYHLESAGVSTDIQVQIPDFSSSNSSRPVQTPLPIIRQDEFRAYVEAASHSKGLQAMASALDVSQSGVKLGRSATMLSRLVYLARGGKAASTPTPGIAWKREQSLMCRRSIALSWWISSPRFFWEALTIWSEGDLTGDIWNLRKRQGGSAGK